jgi:hypothetical protein
MCRRSVRVHRRVRAVELNRFGVLFDGLKFLKEGRKGASSSSASASLMYVLSRAFFNEHAFHGKTREKCTKNETRQHFHERIKETHLLVPLVLIQNVPGFFTSNRVLFGERCHLLEKFVTLLRSPKRVEKKSMKIKLR